VFFPGARFFEPAVFRRLDTWHGRLILYREVQGIVALFTGNRGAGFPGRARSGTSCTRLSGHGIGMRQDVFWFNNFADRFRWTGF
jgi:hypothetical protein